MTGRPHDAALSQEAITTFARVMTHELECNAHKGDPRELTALEHVHELLYHAAKLYMAVRFAHPEAALEYAADCGNHAWMAAQAAEVLDVAYITTDGEGGTLTGDDDGYDGALPWHEHYDALKALATTAFGDQLAELAAAADAPSPEHAIGNTTGPRAVVHPATGPEDHTRAGGEWWPPAGRGLAPVGSPSSPAGPALTKWLCAADEEAA